MSAGGRRLKLRPASERRCAVRGGALQGSASAAWGSVAVSSTTSKLGRAGFSGLGLRGERRAAGGGGDGGGVGTVLAPLPFPISVATSRPKKLGFAPLCLPMAKSYVL